MKIAVAGGTGVAGAWTVKALADAGHEVVVIARSTGVDVLTGDGLVDALKGANAVVDATSTSAAKARSAIAFFETATRNLSRASAEAGVQHLVSLSIIGIDRVPSGYYRGKLAQEQALGRAAVPVSIVRAAQFHEFAGQYLDRMRSKTVVVPTWRVQPVAAQEVGAFLAEVAVGHAVGTVEIAGPRMARMADLVRATAAARGEDRRIIEVRIPGRVGRAMAHGGNVPQGEARFATQTFDQFLRTASAP